MKITNETKVGIFTTVALIILIFGYSYMQGMDLFSKSNTFYAQYEKVDGLRGSNPVLLNGYEVGRVRDIRLSTDEGVNITVKFTVSNDVKLPKNTKAKIINYDLLGAKAIDLKVGDSPDFAVDKDTLSGDIELSLTESVNQILAPVKQRTENLITSVDTMVTTLQGILETADIKFMLKSLERTFSTLERTSGRLDTMVSEEATRVDRILANVESISRNFRANNEDLSKVISNFSSISDSLVAADIKKTIDETTQTLDEFNDILAKVNRGEGTAGKLLNDDEMYERIDAVSRSFEGLTTDIRENPHRYLNISLLNLRRSQPDDRKSDKNEKKKSKEED